MWIIIRTCSYQQSPIRSPSMPLLREVLVILQVNETVISEYQSGSKIAR